MVSYLSRAKLGMPPIVIRPTTSRLNAASFTDFEFFDTVSSSCLRGRIQPRASLLDWIAIVRQHRPRILRRPVIPNIYSELVQLRCNQTATPSSPADV